MLFADEKETFSPIEPKLNLSKEMEIKFIGDYKSWLIKNKTYYRPAIVWAAVDGQKWLVEMLIRNNEPIDTEEQDGGNALSAAILNKRDSIVSLLLDNGADLRVIQEMLGHANITSTDRYTHVSQNQVQESFHNFHPRNTGSQ